VLLAAGLAVRFAGTAMELLLYRCIAAATGVTGLKPSSTMDELCPNIGL
jgi:hypothetical protein